MFLAAFYVHSKQTVYVRQWGNMRGKDLEKLSV